MKKTLLTTALISGAVLGLGAMNSVSAADTPTSKDTTASATFTAGGGTGPDAGPLAITNVTAGIDFGSNKIAAITTDYPAKAGVNVTVSDLRGLFTGWNVTVAGTPLMSVGDNSTALEGASLTLPIGAVSSAEANNTAADGVTAKSVGNVLSGSSVAISAPVGKGTGSILTDYKADDIKLNVIGGSAHAAAYATKLTWSLTDGPKD
ncbi:WxL domain-containing protein [Dellaglioa carnosa]|uniref:WxL domain-containing protein n=1 Tax=Dellaglioa carnosa TaxID=2995136 RepID=UPI0022A816A7|nr:WxL domain-containing protein [Dellaglioa carnosa]MCZ2493111.1 WxL domain-containing protein [Dellaglioa carnosa]